MNMNTCLHLHRYKPHHLAAIFGHLPQDLRTVLVEVRGGDAEKESVFFLFRACMYACMRAEGTLIMSGRRNRCEMCWRRGFESKG